MGRAGPPPPPPPDPSSSAPNHQHHSTPSPSFLFLSADLTSPVSDLTASSVLAPDLVAATSSAGQSSSDLQPTRRRCSLSTRSSGLAAFSSRSSFPAAAPVQDLAPAGPPAGFPSSVHLLPLQAASSLSRSSVVAAVSPSSSSLAAARALNLVDAGSTAVLPSSGQLQLSSSVFNPRHQLPPRDASGSVAPELAAAGSSAGPYSAAELPLPPDPFPSLPSRASQTTSPNPLLAPPPPSSSALSHPQLTSPHSSQPRPFALAADPSVPAPRSFAQVSKSSKGSGFVRSHADEIESFARLPRTGAKIICGHREGIPSFSFINSDLPSVEGLYSNALVMKFHGGRPSLEVSHKEIQSWGLEHPFTIGPLTSRSFLLRFQDHKDLIRVLTRPSTLLISYAYKIFKWHNQCHLSEDSCFAPVWISLPRLPLQCFIPEFLEAVANQLGRFLCFDKATSTLARPSAARLCVELDLRKSLPQFIWVGLFEGFKQPIIYERLPKFCNLCQAQGHEAIGCPVGRRETLPTHPDARSMHNQQRTPRVRRNAAKAPSTQKLNVFPPPAVPTPPFPSHPDVVQPAVPAFAQTAAPPPPLQSSATTSSTTTPNPTADHFQFQPTSQRAPSSAANVITPPPQSPLISPPAAATVPNDTLLQVRTSTALLQQDHAATESSAAPSTGSVYQLTNIEANIEHWEAVNRQVAILEQARISLAPTPSLLPHADVARQHPLEIASPAYAPLQAQPSAAFLQQPPAAAGPSGSLPQAPPPAALLQHPPAAAGPPDAPAQPSATLLQRDPAAAEPTAAPSACHESAAPSFPPAASSAILSHASDLMIPSITQKSPTPNPSSSPSPKSLEGSHKSTNVKPSDVGISASLSQQQRAALEQFKSKVLHHTQSRGKQLSSPISVNHFEALRYDHSDADGEDASYYSDTDDGCVEPIDLGYQSANGRSSKKHKDFAPSGMRINKRHPNMPLRVKLRSRKNSHPSTP